MVTRFKTLIACALLASYISYVGTVCLCVATQTVDFEVRTDRQTDDQHHHNQPDSHNHSDQEHSKTETCCKDIRAVFLSNAPKLISETLKFGYNLAVVTYGQVFTVERAVEVFSDLDTRGSPPKNQNIRIFIQSFLV